MTMMGKKDKHKGLEQVDLSLVCMNGYAKEYDEKTILIKGIRRKISGDIVIDKSIK